MPCRADYCRTCELCCFTGKTASNWSKHIKTKKHLLAVENAKLKQQNEKYRIMELEMELEKLKEKYSSNTINDASNNTINIDNSNNTTNNNININIFVANPNANNLTDVVIPCLDELLETKTIPAEAIQKCILQMGDEKPLLIRNEQLWIKQIDWKKGADAEKELNVFCNKTQHKLIKEMNDMVESGDDEKYFEATQLVFLNEINKDTITRKVKAKMITPNYNQLRN